MPVPGFVAVKEFSSIQPLKTDPNPPPPSTLSGRKFRVDIFISEKLKLFRFDDCKISPSVRGVGGTDVGDILVLSMLSLFSSELTYSPGFIN